MHQFEIQGMETGVDTEEDVIVPMNGESWLEKLHWSLRERGITVSKGFVQVILVTALVNVILFVGWNGGSVVEPARVSSNALPIQQFSELESREHAQAANQEHSRFIPVTVAESYSPCDDGDEIFEGLCYASCSRLTKGTHPIRSAACTCCKVHPCSGANIITDCTANWKHSVKRLRPLAEQTEDGENREANTNTNAEEVIEGLSVEGKKLRDANESALDGLSAKNSKRRETNESTLEDLSAQNNKLRLANDSTLESFSVRNSSHGEIDRHGNGREGKSKSAIERAEQFLGLSAQIDKIRDGNVSAQNTFRDAEELSAQNYESQDANQSTLEGLSMRGSSHSDVARSAEHEKRGQKNTMKGLSAHRSRKEVDRSEDEKDPKPKSAIEKAEHFFGLAAQNNKLRDTNETHLEGLFVQSSKHGDANKSTVESLSAQQSELRKGNMSSFEGLSAWNSSRNDVDRSNEDEDRERKNPMKKEVHLVEGLSAQKNGFREEFGNGNKSRLPVIEETLEEEALEPEALQLKEPPETRHSLKVGPSLPSTY